MLNRTWQNFKQATLYHVQRHFEGCILSHNVVSDQGSELRQNSWRQIKSLLDSPITLINRKKGHKSLRLLVCCVNGNGGVGVRFHALVHVVKDNRSLVLFTYTIVRVVRGKGGLVPLHLDADVVLEETADVGILQKDAKLGLLK